jgi:hypothetical protein
LEGVGGDGSVTLSHDEVERAIASVPGVETASFGGTGTRGRVTIDLAPGASPERVSRKVAKMLRERFGITLPPDALRHRMLQQPGPQAGAGTDVTGAEVDPVPKPTTARPSLKETAERAVEGVHRGAGRARSTARRPGVDALFDGSDREPDTPESDDSGPTPDAEEAAVAEEGAVVLHAASRHRVAIRELVTTQGEWRTHAVAELTLGDRIGRGTSEAIATDTGLWRAIGEATLAGFLELSPSGWRAVIDRITVAPHGHPPMATVVVSAWFDRGEEALLGAALLHDDPRRAIMHATLDALNGRVELVGLPGGASLEAG